MTELARDAEWQRLDSRMLLVHPIRELIRFLPAIIVIALGSAASGGEKWQLIGVGIPVALGVMRYLTTSFRINGGRIELKRGLLNRHVLSTPVDRVRTVDLTSSPIHRVLGLTKVRIGTGTASTSDEDRIDLDGLPLDRARRLRTELLQRSSADDAVAPAAAAPDTPVLTFDPAWLRFAPLTGTGVVIGAAALGAGSQLLQTVGFWEWFDWDSLDAPGLSLAVLIPLLVLALLVVVSALAIVGYAVTNWGFRLTRDRVASTWHLTRGLITTRETTIDDDRLAGANVSEPLGLRLAGGARLSAIVTGLGRGQQGSSVLVPPAPRAVVEEVAGEILDSPEPLSAPLTRHGPRATRRRWTRALVPACVLAAAVASPVALNGPRWLLVGVLAVPVAALLARDRVRSLGHTLVAGYLVARSGSLVRRRRILEIDHVIGWNLRATWFQRRAGLTTLVATTAGGNQAVEVLDVPDDEAIRVAHAALPELVAQFSASG
ncbi:MAG TPA: PH domain-containing protein [Nocardioides sp.]|uniref:PH domain-containing protein n=1 Tax=Nocardioides sp. TaxID=35761 RepID=UPI002E359187|nr:PH domain-containing protein [Nocardioides sp.]HEX5086538.1 PH domain-containing protein [Nocardioides sp.]